MVERRDKKLNIFKRTLAYRLDLDGIREFFKSSRPVERSIWFCVTLLAYLCAAYFSYITVQRFRLDKKTVLAVDHRPPIDRVLYPSRITLCHGIFWNKTYLEETVQIPNDIYEQARKKLDWNSKTWLLTEFMKYVNYYHIFHFGNDDEEENIREDVWDVMRQLYERIFVKDVQFSSIVADAAIRSNIMERCWYKNRQYKCDRSAFASTSVDSPGCHVIPISDGRRTGFESDTLERAVLNFEISLPTKHIFQAHDYSNHTANGNNMENLGLKIYVDPDPTPFSPHLAIPANTHAHIVFYHKQKYLQRDCQHDQSLIEPDFTWPGQIFESCLGSMFEMAAFSFCGCFFVSGSFYPPNDLVCTPEKMRKCVQPQVLPMFGENDVMFRRKRQCQRACVTDDVIASVTYHNLENTSADYLRNLITIRPNLEQGSYTVETNLTNSYPLLRSVGFIVMVFTGMSIAAFVRVSALLAGAGLLLLDRNIIKPVLGTWTQTPLSVRWDVMAIMAYRRSNVFKIRADSAHR